MIWCSAITICLCLINIYLILIRHLIRLPESYREGYAYPTIGEYIPFYDDGKGGLSRRFIAQVVDIIEFNKAPKRVRAAWKEEVRNCPWLYDRITTHFIVVKSPEYDNHLLYCAQDCYGGWFSICVDQWQSGQLDVDGARTAEIYWCHIRDGYFDIPFNTELAPIIVDTLLYNAFAKHCIANDVE